ncbi:MAG TPA: hypothetical protein DD438_06480 [Verrucomicrobiales bacterium]|nr:hypothetical protein [Verrucomicrobiales bacterium]|tara:strand:+ start:555 stop:1130 length:576 start_codon:yes stop_codon:yes gene_type:complete
MKIFLLLLLTLVSSAVAEIEWRSFENADKTKSFQGRLVGYNPLTKKVTVQRQSTLRPVTFQIDLLSEEHRTFVESRAVELEAAGGLRMMFYENVHKVGSTRSGSTKTSSYDGGYKIEIRNYLRRAIQDVSVDYLIVYRKDSTKGNGTRSIKRGSRNLTALIPNYDENIIINGIPLTSYYKAGSVTAAAGST